MANKHARNWYGIPSLAQAIYGFVIVSALVAVAAIVLTLQHRARMFEHEVQMEAVTIRGEALRNTFTKTIEREWTGLQAASRIIDPSDPVALRDIFTAVSRRGRNIAWAGYADRGGVLVAGSRGLLEGENVRDEEWFSSGLEGNFVGEVREFRPLARFIQTEDEELLKYVDMSAPRRDATGKVTGVVVYRLRISAMEDYLAELGRDMRTDVFLFDTNGDEIFSIHERSPVPLSPASMQLIETGTAGTRLLEGIDGVLYAVSHMPSLSYSIMPSLGWELAVRVPGRTSETGLRELSTSILLIVVGLAIALLVATQIFVFHFVRPLARLSEEATEIADGKDVFPHESRSSREMALLSAAIVRLQARLNR